MAVELVGIDVPRIASSNVTTLSYSGNPATYSSGGIPQYYIVVPDTSDGTNGAVTLAADANTIPMGVAQDGPAVTAGQSVRVRISGESKVIAGAAITYGAQVSANASGQAVTSASAGATDKYVLGYALTAATAAGDVITVQLAIGATTQVSS